MQAQFKAKPRYTINDIDGYDKLPSVRSLLAKLKSISIETMSILEKESQHGEESSIMAKMLTDALESVLPLWPAYSRQERLVNTRCNELIQKINRFLLANLIAV